MALVSMRQLLDHAAEHSYGLPAFNVNSDLWVLTAPLWYVGLPNSSALIALAQICASTLVITPMYRNRNV